MRSLVFGALLLPLLAAADPKEWKKVAPDKAGFQVLMPGEPKFSTNPPNAKDDPKATRRFTWANSPAYFFIASYQDLPGRPTPKSLEAKELERVRDAEVKGLKGELAKDAEHKQAGLVGREFTVRHPNFDCRERVFLRYDRLFKVYVIGTPEEVASAEGTKFLDSFEQAPGMPEKWKAVAPKEGGFRVLMPAEPKETTDPPGAARDDKNAARDFTWAHTKTNLFVVNYRYLPPDSVPPDKAKAYLERVRDEKLKEKNSPLVKDAERKLGALTGRDFTLKVEDHHLRFCVFVAGDRLYQACVTGTADEVTGEEAEKFFKSFEILDKKP
jgi:hypothetical protein